MWRDDQASIWTFYVQNIPKSSDKNVNKYNTQFILIKLSKKFWKNLIFHVQFIQMTDV